MRRVVQHVVAFFVGGVGIHALRQQKAHHLGAPVEGGEHQRIRAVHVAQMNFRALLRQMLHAGEIAGDGSGKEGALFGLVQRIDVRAVRKQQRQYIHVPLFGSQHQRRALAGQTAGRRGIDIRARFQQQPDGVRVPVLHRVHQRRFAGLITVDGLRQIHQRKFRP